VLTDRGGGIRAENGTELALIEIYGGKMIGSPLADQS
jgi:hypothetical protein